MWEPITLEGLKRHINNLEYLFSEDQKSFWNFIKISPQKWGEASMGELGGGFWAVALFGRHVMYYNDIEEGFTISSFQQYGTIDHYYPNQSELHELVAALFNDIKKGLLSFNDR